MKTNQRLAALGVAVLAVTLANINAKAQGVPVFQGTFTLPATTQWGKANLPAGDYTLSLDHEYPGSMVTIFRGTQTVARIQTVGISTFNSGKANLAIVGGTVREMNVAQLGLSFHYAGPAGGHRMSPQQPSLAQSVAINPVRAGR